MNHIVFIVSSYYPYFSAGGKCCFNIAEEMVKKNKVTVICLKSFNRQHGVEEYQGQTIIRVSYKRWDMRLKLDEKIKRSSGVTKEWYILLLNIIRLQEFIQTILSRVSIKKTLTRAYLDALFNIKGSIDVVVPLCFPMEAVIAGMEYKKKFRKVKLIPYLFDPFVDSHTLHRTKWNMRLKRKNHIRIENEMLSLSSKVFCINHLCEYFIQYKGYVSDLLFTEHPLIKKIPENNKLKIIEKSNIKITYTGVFNKIIRNPGYFLRFMLSVLLKYDARLHLYSYGNCENIIKKYTNKSAGRILNHGFVPNKEANNAMHTSDVLVSVGNIDNLQVPSKIFEYMSAGKPIVHFYAAPDDMNVKILKDYPLCLCLKQDESQLQENVEKFIRFCQKNKGKTLDFKEIEKIYYNATPKYISNQINNVITALVSKNSK